MNDLPTTVRQILLDTVMLDTYVRNEDGDFVPINWERSPLLDDAVARIVAAVRQENVTDKVLSALTKEGQPVCAIQCNKCGYTEVYQPTDITAEDFKKDGKAVVEKGKEYFAKKGWRTSWVRDLCPRCVKEKS